MLFIFPTIQAGEVRLLGVLFRISARLSMEDASPVVSDFRKLEKSDGRRAGGVVRAQHKTVSGCTLCYKLLIFVPLRLLLSTN